MLQQVYPTREGSILDLEQLRAELIAKLHGSEKCLLAGGGVFEMGKQNRVKTYLPEGS